MFGKSKIMIALCTLLAAGVTYVVFSYCYPRSAAFFYTLGGLLLSEVLAGFVCMELCKTDRKAMPFIVANGFIGVIYFLFALVMIIPFAEGVSADVLRLWHLAGLLSAVIFHILLGLGHRSSMSLEKAQEKSMSCKKEFNLALERFKSDHGQWLAADPVLAKKLLSLFESIRFSSESTPAAAECDQEIFESFQQLQKVENVKEALEKIEKISSQVAFRNQVIKASR